MSNDDPGRIEWEVAISGAWPLPKQREHLLGDDEWCWCQPRIESRMNLAGEWCEIVIHQGEQA